MNNFFQMIACERVADGSGFVVPSRSVPVDG